MRVMRMIPEDIVVEHESLNATAFSPSKMAATCSELRCGTLIMLRTGCGFNTDLRVLVKVYRTSLEHFAVLYPEKLISKPFGFINLKNCNVECMRNNPRVLQIVQRNCDGGVLTFRAESTMDAKLWQEALQSKTLFSTKKRLDDVINVSLPILEEGDEE